MMVSQKFVTLVTVCAIALAVAQSWGPEDVKPIKKTGFRLLPE
jgi:hypothetical protein